MSLMGAYMGRIFPEGNLGICSKTGPSKIVMLFDTELLLLGSYPKEIIRTRTKV